MVARKLEGLAAIAAACDCSVDELVAWHRDFGFPLTRKGSRWSSSVEDIEAWARARRQAERRGISKR